MHHRNVISLQVVIDVHLPVARHLILATIQARVADRRIEVHHTDEVVQKVRKWRRLQIKVRKDEWSPRVHLNGHEAHLVSAEVPRVIHPRCVAQCPVEAVRPPVILALHRLALPAAGGHRACAMETHVVEATECLSVTHDDDGVAGEICREELSVGLHRRGVTDQLPGASKHALLFEREHHRIGVQARWQG